MTIDFWGEDTPEANRVLAEERALLEGAELVALALRSRGISQSELAKRLNRSKSAVSQSLSGDRNLTLKSLAAMLDALEYRLEIACADQLNQAAVALSRPRHDIQPPAAARTTKLRVIQEAVEAPEPIKEDVTNREWVNVTSSSRHLKAVSEQIPA